MFQTISWAVFVIIFLGMLMHIAVDLVGGEFKNKNNSKFGKFRWCGWREDLSCFSKLKRVVLIISVVCLMVMSFTAFSGRLAADKLMTGYVLMIHVGTAPVFILCLLFLIVSWGYQCRLTDTEWEEFLERLQFKTTDSKGSMLLIKLTFWLTMLLSVPVSLSMLVSMFTFFGTHSQEVLFNIHQYTSLALLSSAVVHIYLLIRNQYK